MSKIKDLKSNPEVIFNLIDVLELFSPDKKSKYTDTLLRLMKNTKNLKSHVDEIKAYFNSNFDFITNEDMNKFSDIQILLMYRFVDSFFNSGDLQNFRKFCEYNERNLISQNDLTTYKSFDEVMNQLSLADLKVSSKDLENEIIKVYEDEEWLLEMVGLNLLKNNNLLPTIDSPIKTRDVYETFLRFDDKPMITGTDAVSKSLLLFRRVEYC